ncbi:hypothetical protein FITA111629_03985 [Filibacter tadaridae]|uniref:Uncharacterized protein n=1 Tax=Filibacter tadaridae TaxID=2483811 RepID=A0A3P5XD76_9BACL|nr:hypothetical protein [Filibacter tadaridae]VDC32631.1 hypothetical protein FILTAD_02833 [Filibacter tadaridae]
MKHIKNDKGYALFLTFVVIILFTVLGMTTLALTSDGMKKNEVREENVQASAQAEKGIEHIVAQINGELQSAIDNGIMTSTGATGIKKSLFEDMLDKTLRKYNCKTGSKIVPKVSGGNGSYEVCIKTIENKESLRKTVHFSSTGISGESSSKTLISKIEIGAEPFPDSLKYTVSAYKSKKCQDSGLCISGEGNLFLHGGISITGDMKVDGNLISTDESYTPTRGQEYYLEDNNWIGSTLPEMKSVSNEENSILTLAGDLYKYSVPSNENYLTNKVRSKNYYKHTTTTDFSNIKYEKKENVQDLFSKAPKLVRNEPIRSDIAIEETISNFSYDKNDSNVEIFNSEGPKVFERHRTFVNVNRPNSKLYAVYCDSGLLSECIFNVNPNFGGTFYMVGDNNIGQFATLENFHIGKHIFGGNIKATFNEGLYVGKNLTIGKTIKSDIGSALGKPNLNVQIAGNIYVNGDLDISGVNGEFNSVIYVNGDVTIDHSILKGLVKDGKEGSLIIFAKGKIKFTKNSLFENTPSEIRGFFYSQTGIEIFASASNIKIKGGLSAPHISLNGTRGRSGTGGLFGLVRPFEPSQHFFGESEYYETVFNQKSNDPEMSTPRLQIEYDQEVIENYSDMKGQEQIIYSVIQPQILSREVN